MMKVTYLGSVVTECLYFSLSFFPSFCKLKKKHTHFFSADLQLPPQDSTHLQLSGPEDVPVVDKKAVERLTEGFLSYYLPDLQNSKRALQELT